MPVTPETWPYISNRPSIPAVGGPLPLPNNYWQPFAGSMDGLYPEATLDGPDRDRVNVDNMVVLAANWAAGKTSVLFPSQQS
jgi:hypothetical protein